MNIGEKIKCLRTQNKLSRSELSKKSGVSEISIRKYETGERSPKLTSIQKLSKALNISPYELIRNDELDHTLQNFFKDVLPPLIQFYKNNEEFLKEINEPDGFEHYKLFIDFLYSKYNAQIEALEREGKFSPLDFISLYELITNTIELKLNEKK